MACGLNGPVDLNDLGGPAGLASLGVVVLNGFACWVDMSLIGRGESCDCTLACTWSASIDVVYC